ncbi:MAG: HEAT repeat domain-containing protein [Candidatus Eisenbacteria bacterium]|nr:HEAT repeat domain-containing protein [Candidatus Eisenbacteria bacterium]
MDEHSARPAAAVPTQTPATPIESDPEREVLVRAAGAWIGQFARTLKTCRLYDAANPAAVRFREELTAALGRLLDAHGAVTYKFSADDVLCEEASLYPAKSRDDNIALPFHRDGVRGLTLSPGTEAREVDAIVDAVLLVTGQGQIEDDLVTLLWEANLRHVDIDYVPGEGDVGAGPGEETGDLVPWPTATVTDEPSSEAAAAASEADADAAVTNPAGSRSDDWTTGDVTVEVDAGFEELDALAPTETERFRDEFAAEHEVPLMTTALAIAHAYMNAPVSDEDRVELAQFLPRMLRLAIGDGLWLEAREALALLRACGSEEWSVETFSQELLQPISITSTAERLDRAEPNQIAECIALARELGEPGIDWLGLLLGASQQRRTRRQLAEAVTALVRDNPERIAPWLADERWEVVRNAAQILGWIGGDAIAGMLQAASRHPEPRVRREVAAALGQVSPDVAKPILMTMLDDPDPRLFGSILHQLAGRRDADVARLVAGYLRDPWFEQRPAEAQRAIYNALATAGTDDVLTDLEAELVKSGGWPSRGQDEHRAMIARCIARLGTVRALAVLERGAEAKRPALRQACADALRTVRVRG